jgi:hypothetical protein
MKRFALLLLSWVPCFSWGQIVMDGNMNEAAWRIIGLSNGNTSFGTDNQLGALKYHSNSTTLYIGITGKIGFDPATVPNIIVFMDLESYQGRGTAQLGKNMDGGAVGPFVTITPFRSGSTTCPNPPTPNGLSASILDNDFDADYAFMINKGNVANTLYVDAIKFSNQANDLTLPAYNAGPGFVGSTDLSGTTASYPISLGSWNTGTNQLSFSYMDGWNASTDPNFGLELSIPYAIIPPASVGQRIRFFVLITNNEGLASNVCIPGNPGAGNLGCGFNLSTNNFDPTNNLFYTQPWEVLPLSFLGFSSAWAAEKIQLNWSVAEQHEANHYEIERSPDGVRFEKLGTLPATEQGSIARYHFIDPVPLSNRNHYRILARKRNGIMVYSKTIVIDNKRISLLNVFPNPSTNKVFIQMGHWQGKPSDWFLFNDLGQRVLSGHVSQAQPLECISFPPLLPSGQYRLTLISEGEIASRTIQIQR